MVSKGKKKFVSKGAHNFSQKFYNHENYRNLYNVFFLQNTSKMANRVGYEKM